MMDVSYQLYSSRNWPMAETLPMIADLGYTQVEGFGGLYPDAATAEELAKSLDKAGLTMPTGHFGLEQVEDDPAGMLAAAKALGISGLFVPYLDADKRPDDAEGWRSFGARLSLAGAPFRDAGLSFGWHNHDFEFAPLPSGEMPIDLILEGGPDLALEMDVAWVVVAGQDPMAWIEKYSDRLAAVHVKDIAPKGEATDEDGWADVGQGTMDWAALLSAAQKAGARTFVAEHDNPSDHQRFASRSIASIRAFEGA